MEKKEIIKKTHVLDQPLLFDKYRLILKQVTIIFLIARTIFNATQLQSPTTFIEINRAISSQESSCQEKQEGKEQHFKQQLQQQ